MNKKTVLVTGGAGFIGFHTAKALLERGDTILLVDNINDYYDENLKYARLEKSGIAARDSIEGNWIYSSLYPDLKFCRMDIADEKAVNKLFEEQEFDYICHLAAQAGVRYSLVNPKAYLRSNLDGFFYLIEGCRKHSVKHFVYASSSSVYGLNADVPYSEDTSVAHPVSLYAATKKSNELIAHAYSHLYGIPTTGLRFFTVYGPWGRPDMSPFIFANAILRGEKIKLFNNGNMLRDFTYIDDIVEGVIKVLDIPAAATPGWNPHKHPAGTSSAPYKLFNIGNSSPVKLMDFLSAMENACGRKAVYEMCPMQPGDVYQTDADTSLLEDYAGYHPSTDIHSGLSSYIKWFKQYYNL